MYTRIFLILLCTMSLSSILAQPLNWSNRKAKEAFYSNNFPEALRQAEKVLQRDSSLVEALFIGGESARQLRKFELAEKYLTQIPDKAKLGNFALTDFNLGLSQKSLGDYNSAILTFQRCLDQRGDDNDLLALHAANELETCHWALRSLESNNLTTVGEAGDNTKSDYSVFAPLRYADKLYFSSAQQDDPKEEPVSRIFTAINDSPVRLFSENPNNEDLHASHTALMPDASRLYYTICKDEHYYQQNRCEIWSMEKTYEGDWTAPTKLPFPINMRGFTTTQPSIGWDLSLKKYVLYFVSDRPGGMGKLDIWYCAIDWDGALGEPVCLSANTESDDVTPFFHQASQTLFFSSDGRAGLGGFDIFEIKKMMDGVWTEPENMGAPINTSFDDLYYTWHTGSQRGYLSSNRGRKDCANAAIGDFCTDLFEAEIFFQLAINAIEEGTDASIENINITIFSEGDQIIIDDLINANKIVLPIGKDYDVMVDAPDYFPANVKIKGRELTNYIELEKKILMTPISGGKIIRP